MLDIAVERPADVETTAAGAAICAGLGGGIWRGEEELPSPSNEGAKVFSPSITSEERARRCSKWQQAVASSLGWAEQRED